MRAVTVLPGGGLEVAERPRPEPGAGEVLVRVHGAGVNRADLLQRAGRYPAPEGVPADIPGLEFAGLVEALGRGAEGPPVGSAVFGITAGGGQAEYLAVPAGQCTRVPSDLDLVAAGGVPEVFVTAHDACCTQARLAAGEWLLVHAAGSGVGTAAVQLGHALGAQVVGTARTAEKLARCEPLGLAAGIVARSDSEGALDVEALAAAIVEATGTGADVALDLVGGPYVEVDIAAAAPRGRIVLVGTLAGGRATVPILAVMGKRLELRGTVLRARSIAEKSQAMAAFALDVVPLLHDRRLVPVLEAVLPLERATEAYDLLASDATFGKVVLDCRG